MTVAATHRHRLVRGALVLAGVLLVCPATSRASDAEEEASLLELQQTDPHPDRVARASLGAARLLYEQALQPDLSDEQRQVAAARALDQLERFVRDFPWNPLAPTVEMLAATCADVLDRPEKMWTLLDDVHRRPPSIVRDDADFWLAERYYRREFTPSELRPEARRLMARIGRESPSVATRALAMARQVVLASLDNAYGECVDVGDHLTSLITSQPKLRRPLDALEQTLACQAHVTMALSADEASDRLTLDVKSVAAAGVPLATAADVVTAELDELGRKAVAAVVLEQLAADVHDSPQRYVFLGRAVALLNDTDSDRLPEILTRIGRAPIPASVPPQAVDAFLTELGKAWKDRAQGSGTNPHDATIARQITRAMQGAATHAELTYQVRLIQAETFTADLSESEGTFKELAGDVAAPPEIRLEAAQHLLREEGTRCDRTDVLKNALDAAQAHHQVPAVAQALRELAVCDAKAAHYDSAVGRLKESLSALGGPPCEEESSTRVVARTAKSPRGARPAGQTASVEDPKPALRVEACRLLSRFQQAGAIDAAARATDAGAAAKLGAIADKLVGRVEECDLLFQARYQQGAALQRSPDTLIASIPVLEGAAVVGAECEDLALSDPEYARDARLDIAVRLGQAYLAAGAIDRVPGALAAVGRSGAKSLTPTRRLLVAHLLTAAGAVTASASLLASIEPDAESTGLYVDELAALVNQAVWIPGPGDDAVVSAALRWQRPHQPLAVLEPLARFNASRGNERAAHRLRLEIISRAPPPGALAEATAYVNAVFDEQILPLTAAWPIMPTEVPSASQEEVVEAFRRLAANDRELHDAQARVEADAQRLNVTPVWAARTAEVLQRRVDALHSLAALARHVRRPKNWSDSAWEQNRAQIEQQVAQVAEGRAAEVAGSIRQLRAALAAVTAPTAGPWPDDVWPPPVLPPFADPRPSEANPANGTPDVSPDRARAQATESLLRDSRNELAQAALVDALVALHLDAAALASARGNARLEARVLIANGRWAAARQALLATQAPRARIELALLDAGLQDWAGTRELATAALKQLPSNGLASLGLALSQLAAGETDSAAAALQVLAGGSGWLPTQAKYYLGLIDELGARADIAAARASYLAFVRESPALSPSHPVFARLLGLPVDEPQPTAEK